MQIESHSNTKDFNVGNLVDNNHRTQTAKWNQDFILLMKNSLFKNPELFPSGLHSAKKTYISHSEAT